jgi:plastocyanin
MIAIILLLARNSFMMLVSLSLTFALSLVAVSNSGITFAQSAETATKLVHAGEGNASIVLNDFIPKNIQINTGESITWDNPTSVPEPHSVTYLQDKKYFPQYAAPFLVSNSTEFQPVDPNSNSEPAFAPAQTDEATKTIVAVNARAVVPTVIDASGNNVTYLQPNSNYTMDGTESYVNSGWLSPEGQAPPGSPPITKFTLTFEKPGTYFYVCNVHPWMTGSVIVK